MHTLIQRSRDGLKYYLLRVSQPARHIWPRASEALLGTLSLVVIGLVVLTYSPAVARHASLWLTGNKYIALIDGMSNPFRNRSLLLQSGLPIYDLKIKAKAFAELEEVVDEARKQGWMSEDQKVEVNAKFYYDNEEYDVSVRIRGDLPPHWEGPKKSWRIQFGKKKIADGDQIIDEPIYFQGRRQINLIIPKDRDFVVAPFVNQLMRNAGLTVPHDQFVILRINGRIQGLYYEVEHFDKPLLASQRRPETTVFGQNGRAMHFEQYTRFGTPITGDAKFDVGSLRAQIDEDATLARRAMEVLMEHARNPTAENFRRARAVLDWDKYIQFRALTTLFNTNHVNFGSDNLKLYYDPSRGLLEPIPWDIHLTRMPKEPGTIDFWNSHGSGNLNRATLFDPELRLQRNKVLWKMLDDGGQQFLADFNAYHDRIRHLAWTDVLTTPVQGETMDVLKHDLEYNVKRVHKVLSHTAANLTYRLQSNDHASIDVVATNFCGIELKKLHIAQPGLFAGSYKLYVDANRDGKLDATDPLFDESTAANGEITFTKSLLILPKVVEGSDLVDGVPWQYINPLSGRAQFILVGKLSDGSMPSSKWTAPKITASAANAVTGQAIASGLINGIEPLPVNTLGIIAYNTSQYFDLDAPDRTLAAFLTAYPQFTSSAEQSGAVELKSRVSLSGTVIVPKSVPLIIRPGTDITMSPGASVVCYGGLTANGTSDQPIHVHGADAQESWGVFAAVRPITNVVLRYVHFSEGKQAEINGILFTGGVAVHHGNLEVVHCSFASMRGEDALNLKNGTIAMVGCRFSQNASDGCDLDFSSGTIDHTHFLECSGDGLEFSGSSADVTHCRFESNSTSGCNVMEDAHPTFLDCLFVSNKVGISCKDLGDVSAAYCSYIANEHGLTAHRTKPYFGGAGGEFANCVFADNRVLLSEDYFSRGRLRLNSSLLDQTTQFESCQTSAITLHDSQNGDYRLTTNAGHSPLSLSRPDWLKAANVPATVILPGVYSALKSPQDSDVLNSSQDEKVIHNEDDAGVHTGGRLGNKAKDASQ